MANKTAYERECAEKCEWCAKGKMRYQSRDGRHYHSPLSAMPITDCTAPTLAESHEALAQALQTIRDEALEEAVKNAEALAALARAIKTRAGKLEGALTLTRVGKLERALTLLYDKWENGTPCFENPEDRNGPLGNAFRLSYEEENEVLELINARVK